MEGHIGKMVRLSNSRTAQRSGRSTGSDTGKMPRPLNSRMAARSGIATANYTERMARLSNSRVAPRIGIAVANPIARIDLRCKTQMAVLFFLDGDEYRVNKYVDNVSSNTEERAVSVFFVGSSCIR